MDEQEAVKLDFSGLKDVLLEAQKRQIDEIREALKPRDPKGKGVIATGGSQGQMLAESFNVMRETGAFKLAEQWTVAIPNYTAYETAAHLRDFVWVQEILKGKAGDTANIPYVKDADFQILAAVGNAFSAETTGLLGSVSTTLYEAGLWSDINYYEIEKYDSNVMEQLNANLAIAGIRAEDAKIMTLIDLLTSTNYAGNVTRLTASAYFYASNIPKALKLLLATGKAVKPGDCVLYMTSHAYGALLEELVASQIIADAEPSIINQGLVQKLYGVNIVVGGYRTRTQRTAGGVATGTVDLCYLMRAKRAVALAPKRDLLIETDKQIATRKLRITASHTFGVNILSGKEIVRIWTSHVESP